MKRTCNKLRVNVDAKREENITGVAYSREIERVLVSLKCAQYVSRVERAGWRGCVSSTSPPLRARAKQ